MNTSNAVEVTELELNAEPTEVGAKPDVDIEPPPQFRLGNILE